MSFQIIGKLHKKFETESKTQTFQAREFVIVVQEGQYPQYVKFQLTQDRCGAIDPYEEGSEIEVHFDLRGREWNGKYFTNLNAWKINGAQKPEDNMDLSQPAPTVNFDEESLTAEDFDDLPF